jgi:MFS transporter, UMF1 family
MFAQSMQENEPAVSESLVYNEKRAKKHLYGWLSYAFARSVPALGTVEERPDVTPISEVFVVVSLTLFLPICLEQFARDNGVLLPEKTEPCLSKDTLPLESNDESQGATRCVVRIGGVWIDSASFRSVHRVLERFHFLSVLG